MPKDADIGRELARRMTEDFSGRINTVSFTYDAYLELDRLVPEEPYCVVTPNTYSQIRESRSMWRDDITLVLTLVSNVGPTDSQEWIDDWLDSWDGMIQAMRNYILFNRHRVGAVETDERYDTNAFHSDKRLITQAVIRFQNITEV